MGDNANDDDGTVVYLGNRKAVEVIEDPDDVAVAAAAGRAPNRTRRPLRGKVCTVVRIPAGTPFMETVTDIVSARGLWPAHSDADAPAWVASSDPTLAQFLARHWGCELRDPEPENAATSADDDTETEA